MFLNIIPLRLCSSTDAADNLNEKFEILPSFEDILSFTNKFTSLQRAIFLGVPDSFGQKFIKTSTANKYYFSDDHFKFLKKVQRASTAGFFFWRFPYLKIRGGRFIGLKRCVLRPRTVVQRCRKNAANY